MALERTKKGLGVLGKTAAGIGGVGLLATGAIGRQLGLGPAGLALAGVGAAFLGGYKMFGGKKAGADKDDVISETNMTEGTFTALNQIYKDTFDIRNWLESGVDKESQKREIALLEDKRWDDILAALRSEGLFVDGDDGGKDEEKKKGGLMSWLGKFYAFKTLLGFLKKFLKFLRIGKLLKFLRIGALILSRFLWPVALIAGAMWLIPKILEKLPELWKFITETMTKVWDYIKNAFEKIKNWTTEIWDETVDFWSDFFGGEDDLDSQLESQQERLDDGTAHPSEVVPETDAIDKGTEGFESLDVSRASPHMSTNMYAQPWTAGESISTTSYPTSAGTSVGTGVKDVAHPVRSEGMVVPVSKGDQPVTTAKDVFETGPQNTLAGVKSIAEKSIPNTQTSPLMNFLKEQEGFEGEAYQDAAGVWTIGYGHTAGVKEGDTITKDDATALLKKDVQQHRDRARRHVGEEVWSGLGQGQRDMLTEMEFNVGLSKFPNFTSAVTSGDWMTASKEYKRHYTEAGTGNKIPMDRRNKAFFEQWLEPMLIGMVADLAAIPMETPEIIIEEETITNSQANNNAVINKSESGTAFGTGNPFTPAQTSMALT